MYQASQSGSPVIQSLMMAFPQDEAAEAIDTQFMWGDSLMIIPVLEEGATKVTAYFPSSIWYDLFSFKQLLRSNGVWARLNAPSETPYLAIRGGSVIVMQEPGLSLQETRLNQHHIVFFLDENQKAVGHFYWKKNSDSRSHYYTFKCSNVSIDGN